ncbi:MAG: hypothetical protein ACRCX8_08775 [Sarcina sp.]
MFKEKVSPAIRILENLGLNSNEYKVISMRADGINVLRICDGKVDKVRY